MSAEVVQCPSCGGETRVPEALFGKAVKCPLCGTTYVAPVFEDGRLVTDATVPPTVTGGRADGDGRRYRRDERRDRNTNQVVGLALLLVGFISLFVNGFSLFTILKDPVQAKENHAVIMKQTAETMKAPEISPEQLEETYQGLVAVIWVSVGVSIVIVAGAASVLARRFYVFACLSTFFAAFNFNNCCCIMGFPIGIWTLIVLLNPDVRQLYRRGGPTADPDPDPDPDSGRAGVGDL